MAAQRAPQCVSSNSIHPSWTSAPLEAKIQSRHLDYKDNNPLDSRDSIRKVRRWTCKLKLIFNLKKEGETGWGSGFFINIPDVPNEVILTAGHNLIRKDGKKPERILVLVSKLSGCTSVGDGLEKASSGVSKTKRPKHSATSNDACTNNTFTNPEKTSKPVNSEKPEASVYEEQFEDAYSIDLSDWDGQVFISDLYESDPGDHNSVPDYGLIIPKRPICTTGPIRGFGFSIDTAYIDFKRAGIAVQVAGYASYSGPSPTRFSCFSGAVTGFSLEQIAYKAKTLQGQSGGPAFISYRGELIVVGIHNHNEQEDLPNTGNRATRLCVAVMYDICRWAGTRFKDTPILLQDISFKVSNTGNDGTLGHFLKLDATHCDDFQPFIRAGKDGTKTAFDILPGYSSASPYPKADSDRSQKPLVESRPRKAIRVAAPLPTYYVIVHLPDPVSSDALVFLELCSPNDSFCVSGREICTERALVYFKFEKEEEVAERDLKRIQGGETFTVTTRLQHGIGKSINDKPNPKSDPIYLKAQWPEGLLYCHEGDEYGSVTTREAKRVPRNAYIPLSPEKFVAVPAYD